MLWRSVVKVTILVFLARNVNALSKSKLEYKKRYLIYNVEADCFLSAGPSELQLDVICDSKLQNAKDFKYTWSFTPIASRESMSYDTDLNVQWRENDHLQSHLHAHFGDNPLPYSQFREHPLVLKKHTVLQTNVHKLSVYQHNIPELMDKWKMLRVDSDAANVETLTKVRFRHSHTKHYLFALSDSDSFRASPIFGWIADLPGEAVLFDKYSKHADFMMLDPAFSYARALSYSFNGSVVEFSWKFNNFGSSTCTSIKLSVGSETFDIPQTSESQSFSVPYDRIAGKNAVDADWYVSCNSENVSTKKGKLDLPRISNIRINSSTPLLVGDNVTFQWDVVGTGPLPVVSGAIFCNHTQVAKIENVLQTKNVQVFIPQHCTTGNNLWFSFDADVETPYKYYSRIENIQMEEKSSLWPGDYVSVSWTSAGPVSPKSVSAELRCNDMILNRVENVFNTSRIQVQVHEECKERGLLFQSDAGTEMISVSHMKLYELTTLNYKIDYLEGLVEVSWKLNSDEEESYRVTEMSVNLFGVQQNTKKTKIRTIYLDMTEMDLKQSNQLKFSHSHMKLQYSWPNVKLGGVRHVDVYSLPNEIFTCHSLYIDLIMKSELLAPVICKCGDNVLLTVSETVIGTSTFAIPMDSCQGKSVALDVEGMETIVLTPLVDLKPKRERFPYYMLIMICVGAGVSLILIIVVISWHCYQYRVRKRKQQEALLRAFGSGKLHIFHIGEFR